jgi:hypothetical protein
MIIGGFVMFRKIKLLIIFAATLFLLSGCNLEKKIEEGITEGILENATDDEDVEVEIDGDEITYSTEEGEVTLDEEGGYTFEGEDGEVMTVSGDNEWPEGLAAEKLPKFDKGVITTTMNLNDSCMLIIEEVEKKDYEEYVEKVKDEGFTEGVYESKSDELSAYGAYLDDNKTCIAVDYYTEESSMSISLYIEKDEN